MKQKPVRILTPINSTTYGSPAVVAFSPNAPCGAPRPSPYVTNPLQCWQNLGTGEVSCLNNESRGGLVRSAVMPLDSPLNRILTREPVGPWELVGFVTSNDVSSTQSRDRTMTVYAQTVDTRRNRYNYRVVDSNSVPMDVGDKVEWKSDGETMSIPGQGATYTLHLYGNFK